MFLLLPRSFEAVHILILAVWMPFLRRRSLLLASETCSRKPGCCTSELDSHDLFQSLSLCEEAARAEGFQTIELMATMAGEPLYRACGYEPCERIMDDRGGVAVPLLRMRKSLAQPRDVRQRDTLES